MLRLTLYKYQELMKYITTIFIHEYFLLNITISHIVHTYQLHRPLNLSNFLKENLWVHCLYMLLSHTSILVLQ